MIAVKVKGCLNLKVDWDKWLVVVRGMHPIANSFGKCVGPRGHPGASHSRSLCYNQSNILDVV